MKRFTKSELSRFLLAIDTHMQQPSTIIVIGGTAALLAYQATRATQDIDTFNPVTGLQKAYAQAKKVTGLNVPLSQATIADAPYHFEDRLQPFQDLPLQRLTILIPEVIDLILMKVIRAAEHDLETIQELIQQQQVSLAALIERYKSEMDHIIGEPQKLKLNFLTMIEENFVNADVASLSQEIGFTQ